MTKRQKGKVCYTKDMETWRHGEMQYIEQEVSELIQAGRRDAQTGK